MERWKAIEGYVLGTDRILCNVSQKCQSRGHNEEFIHHLLSALIKSGSSHINFPTHSVCIWSREMQVSPSLHPTMPGQDVRGLKHKAEELYLYKAIQSLHVVDWHNSDWRNR